MSHASIGALGRLPFMRPASRVPAIAIAMTLALGVCGAPSGAFAATGATARVSVSSAGAQGVRESAYPVMSADGRYVAFESYASNLVAGDTNDSHDIFVRDRVTNATTRVSVDSSGTQGDGPSFGASISADGRYVAFQSWASNLDAADTSPNSDVFVHDRLTGATTCVTAGPLDSSDDGWKASPSLSADGRYVVFVWDRTNEWGGSDLVTNTYVHDRLAGVTTTIAAGAVNEVEWKPYWQPSISADGRYVAFVGDASDLVTGDTNDATDVFVRDTVAGVTTRVSVDSAGEQASGESWGPTITGDGRYIVFDSAAPDLVAGDTNDARDVFIHDRVAGTTTRLSVDSAGVQAAGGCYTPSISADGRYVAFLSDAANLVAADANGTTDVFMRDRTAGTTIRVSVDSAGGEGTGQSRSPSISADGRFTAFGSEACNLMTGDTNGMEDVFVNELAANVAPHTQPTTVGIRASAAVAWTGRVVTLSGAMSPTGVIGKLMAVYVMKPGSARWSYSSNRGVYPLPGGAAWLYKYLFKPGMAKGLYRYKAVFPATTGYAGCTSPTIVTVRLR